MKKRLPTDWTPDLPEVQEDQLVQRALRQKLDADYRSKWQQQLAKQGIERDPSAKVVRLNPVRRYLSVAAAVAALLVAGWWFFGQSGGADPQQLALQYLGETADQLAQVRMGADSNQEDALWQTGREWYTQKQYAETITTLETLARQKTLTPEQSLLLAMSFAQVHPPAYDQALQQLAHAQQVNSDLGTATYREEIEWLKALVLYQKGAVEEAKSAFDKIIEAGGWYAEKAGKMRKG